MMDTFPDDVNVFEMSQPGPRMDFIPPVPVSKEKNRKVKDSVSWSICFGIVALITGALLVYKIGVTMSTLTSILFYFSLSGLIYFIGRIFWLSRAGENVAGAKSPHLN